ncbi:MFS transporter [Patescibacteria group bacterium]|nr:MFS transporter [Patescibacteria group bacterium]MCL5733633.1 MFS transporter [Patescibacteria group bacterium]
MWKEPGFLQLIYFRILRSVSAGMLIVVFPYFILKNFSHPSLTLGLLYTAGTITTAFAGALFGILFDKHPNKMLVIAVNGLLILGLLALVLGDKSLPFVFIASALGGFSATGSIAGGGVGGVAAPIQNAVAARLIPENERTNAYTVLMFIGGIASIVGIAVAGILKAETNFEIAAVLAIISIIPLLFLPKKSFRVIAKTTQDGRGQALRNFSITGLLNGLAQGLIIPFLIPFFFLVYHVSSAQMSIYASVSGILAILAILSAPWLDKNFGLVKSMILTRGIGIFAIIALPLVRYFPLAIFIYLITPALRVMALPVQQRAITSIAGEGDTATVLGFNQSTRLLAASGGSAIAGLLFEQSLIAIPFYGYAVVAGYNLYLYKKFFGKKRGDEIKIKN